MNAAILPAPEYSEQPIPQTLKDFLEKFGSAIKTKVGKNFSPLHDLEALTEKDLLFEKRLMGLKRKPKNGQIAPILATIKGFKRFPTLFMIGEMGVGKTYIGIASSLLLCKERSRTLVLCPTHLIEKWIREIRMVAPNAIVHDMSTKSLSDVFALKKDAKPIGREFYILGKETAKMHYNRRPAVTSSRGISKCPDCGTQIIGIPDVNKHRPVCSNCTKPLWEADKNGFRRFAKAEFIKKYLGKHAFDLLLADEVHQYKAGDSSQGQAYAHLVKRSKKVLNLTGTIMGGYSTNLFYLLWRSCHKAIERVCGYRKPMDFAKRYGVVDRIEKVVQDASSSSIGRSKTYVRVAEKPGICPTILTDMLLERCIFVSLTDVANSLPSYKEDVVEVAMSEEQGTEYKAFEETLVSAVREALARGDKSLLGPMVQSLLAYPDGCRRGESVYHPRKKEPDGSPILIAQAPAINDPMLQKEEALIELVKKQRKRGRKCLVCLEHTGTRDIIPDLKSRLEADGNSVLAIRSTSCPAKNREEWLLKKMKEREYSVAITNPKLIETGLDLIMFPTIIFFQTGYSTFTLRQASRRSWRIGQENDVEVYYLVYKDTAQDTALSLMADKMQVALVVEGNLSDAGLTSIAQGEASILVQVAKTVLGDKKSGPPARTVFKSMANIYAENESRIDVPTRIETPKNIVHLCHKGKDPIKARRQLLGIVTLNPNGGYAETAVKGAILIFRDGIIYNNGTPVGRYHKNGFGFIQSRGSNTGSKTIIRYIQLQSIETKQFGLFSMTPLSRSRKAA